MLTGDSSSIFTGIFYEHYSAPAGFCFDVQCNDEPFIDNPRSPDYNVVRKVLVYLNDDKVFLYNEL